MRLNNVEEAIFQTLIYSDIFNFPLTKKEIWRWLITSKKIKREEFEKALNALIKASQVAQVPRVSQASLDNFYCLIGREKIILKRKNNIKEIEKKLTIAKKAAYYLSFVPTIKFIGISGGLATGNTEEQDDIDFFIIAKKNSLFTTRFLALTILEILKLRRKRNDKNPGSKICLNLLIDEDNLSWSNKMQDLYTAHEIVQIKPLLEKNEMYRKFLVANNWVKKYFANNNSVGNHLFRSNHDRDYVFLLPLELLMRKLQEYYMRKHKTTEIISRGFIAFHPKDYRTKTMTILRSKYRNLGLLTNF